MTQPAASKAFDATAAYKSYGTDVSALTKDVASSNESKAQKIVEKTKALFKKLESNGIAGADAKEQIENQLQKVLNGKEELFERVGTLLTKAIKPPITEADLQEQIKISYSGKNKNKFYQGVANYVNSLKKEGMDKDEAAEKIQDYLVTMSTSIGLPLSKDEAELVWEDVAAKFPKVFGK
ncbi:MAG TPA: hypothetical protein VN457_06010 [Chlamydiales bacterium]|nr:hypothetical protein [Chlamydiales bacterium]